MDLRSLRGGSWILSGTLCVKCSQMYVKEDFKVFHDFFDFQNLAPNTMTIMGLIFPLIHFAVLLYYDWTFSAVLPNWTFLLGAFSLFWYQTIDAVDGKQARRTDNCSSLGQLLDHSNIYIALFLMQILIKYHTRFSSWLAAHCSEQLTTFGISS